MTLYTVKEGKATTVRAASKLEAERKAKRQFEDEEAYEYDEFFTIEEVRP